ncbi:hypothetical protein G6011_06311 [Alternaria panax]|uniref:P-loop containing nucleoside triphosphate hydrolase protein n=1 Tax=Alternaria panax TaxID=48097 RepID=A0AAD4FGA1_9PLEO|nr:hypothetical protein G6011_06311 [Alternaria panax]
MLRTKKPKGPNPLKIVVVGEELVGKTCFIDMFLEGKHFISHGSVDSEPPSRTITHAKETWSLSFIDLNLNSDISPRYREVLDAYVASADGVVLLYDVTSLSTFDHLIQHTYLQIWHCRNTVFIKNGTEGRMQEVKKRFGCVVVGNKNDIVDEDEGKRQVRKEMADQWAASQGFRHIEVSSNERQEVEDSVRALVDSVQRARRMDARDIRDSKSDVKGWSKKTAKQIMNG